MLGRGVPGGVASGWPSAASSSWSKLCCHQVQRISVVQKTIHLQILVLSNFPKSKSEWFTNHFIKYDNSPITTRWKSHFTIRVPTSTSTFSGDSATSQLPGLAGTTVETLVFGLSASGLSPGPVALATKFGNMSHLFSKSLLSLGEYLVFAMCMPQTQGHLFCIDPSAFWCRKCRKGFLLSKDPWEIALNFEKPAWIACHGCPPLRWRIGRGKFQAISTSKSSDSKLTPYTLTSFRHNPLTCTRRE